jgi:uncharacterized Zn-binding protein involved in type VI secretion
MPAAARTFDLTNHGGLIVGPGCPNVHIGGMAAARAGDAQVCPMVDVLKPHVGGTIASGSATVFIGGAPAARVGDVVLCAGPPGAIASGCPTVQIG